MGVIGYKTLGVGALTAVHTTPQHPLGFRAVDDEGNEYTYVKAGGAINAAFPAKIAAGYVATASGNAGFVFGIAVATLALDEYGWLQTKGVFANANVAAATASGAALARKSDANGDLVTVADAGGTSQNSFAIALEGEAAGLADILIL